MILENHSLELLAQAGRSKQTLSSLPSWVPDWSENGIRSLHIGHGSKPLDRGLKPLDKSMRFDIEGNVLKLRGILLDTINEVSVPIDLAEMLRPFCSEEMTGAPKMLQNAPQDWLRAICRTAVRGYRTYNGRECVSSRKADFSVMNE
jgi:hypothetical protein